MHSIFTRQYNVNIVLIFGHYIYHEKRWSSHFKIDKLDQKIFYSFSVNFSTKVCYSAILIDANSSFQIRTIVWNMESLINSRSWKHARVWISRVFFFGTCGHQTYVDHPCRIEINLIKIAVGWLPFPYRI